MHSINIMSELQNLPFTRVLFPHKPSLVSLVAGGRIMIQVIALEACVPEKAEHRDRETDHFRACVVAWLCRGCVGTCSSRVLTLSPAAPKGPQACYGGLWKSQHSETIAALRFGCPLGAGKR